MSKKKSLDDVLDSMVLFRQYEKKMVERGADPSALREATDPNDKYTFFKKKTSRDYGSNCELYGGYYLDGVHGAVSCSAVEFLLPGIIRALYCEKNCENCPLHGGGNEE